MGGGGVPLPKSLKSTKISTSLETVVVPRGEDTSIPPLPRAVSCFSAFYKSIMQIPQKGVGSGVQKL